MTLDSSLSPLIAREHKQQEEALMERNRAEPREALMGSINTNRACVLLLLAAIVGLSLFFQGALTEQADEIHRDELKIAHLEHVVSIHEEVIERFNNSVTNSDVLTRLHELELKMDLTKLDLLKELNETEKHIAEELNHTVDILGETVAEAQKEIEDEVEHVKKDVESYVRKTEDQFSMENSFMVFQLAGTFTLLSCLISMWHMTAHLRKMHQPVVQRKILAILWMCPIYAITSWFSLVFHSAEGYLAIVKDFYEAYIIYQFLSFCIAVLGKGDREVVIDLLAKHADHLSPPFRFDGCCNPNPYRTDRELARAVLLQCQSFAMQFVFLRPLTTTATFVLDKVQYYGPTGNPMDYRSPQFYLVGLQNFSVFVAFTGLLKFYHAVDQELAWCRPFAKFLCIKGVVFMTFWQGLAISILATTTDVGGNDAEEWAASAQNFLICLEMLLFSIAHFYCFPTEEWQEGYKAKHQKGAFGDSIALGDFMSDLKMILKADDKKKRRKSKKLKSIKSAIPEGDEEDDNETTVTSRSDSDKELDIAAIAESLENADEDDADIEAATKRLLSSSILDGEDWSGVAEDDDDEDDKDDKDVAGVHENAKDSEKPENDYGHVIEDAEKNAELLATEDADQTTAEVRDLKYMGTSPTTENSSASGPDSGTEDPPNESTGLLSGTSNPYDSSDPPFLSESTESLRPSIFTMTNQLDDSANAFEEEPMGPPPPNSEATQGRLPTI